MQWDGDGIQMCEASSPRSAGLTLLQGSLIEPTYRQILALCNPIPLRGGCQTRPLQQAAAIHTVRCSSIALESCSIPSRVL